SCLQQAAARLALPWQDARCVSLHGRSDYRPLASALRRALHRGDPVCVLTDGHNTPGAIARFLIERGVAGLRLHAFADMGSPGERHVTIALPLDTSRPENHAAGLRQRGEPGNRDELNERDELDELGGNCTVLLVPRATPVLSLRAGSPQGAEGDAALPVLGIPDTDFDVQARLITKWPVRAAGLAALRIAPGHTVWDLGAGSGAVSVEAAA
ncbi:bifunctional cobalt-precorrin-7 (C(5))-methyltransferase/cobalt-precorrin-6B (C(15))-methyltransferase, partial [Desulfovibrio oxamicus]